MSALRRDGGHAAGEARATEQRATRIGIAVHGRQLRLVGVRGAPPNGLLCWAIEGELEPDEPIASGVRELLAGAPLRKWPAPGVVVAVGGLAGQVKPLHGLPAADDPEVLARIVGASPTRFFLRNGVPVVAGGVRVDADGTTWGTAFAATLPAQLAESVRAAGGELVSLTTLPVATARAVAADEPDGGERLVACDDEEGGMSSDQRIRVRGGRFAGAWRGALPDAGRDVEVPWAPALAALGPDAARWAAAYGAALLSPDEPLVLRPAEPSRIRAGRRRAVAAASLAVATVLALVLPPWRARALERQAMTAVAARGPRFAAALRAESRLVATDAALAQAAAWDARRVSRLALLERLTTALPEGAALVSLRADTVDATIVVVAPRMAVVTAALERARDLTGLALVGAVSREMTGGAAGAYGGRELERATYRLRLAREER